MKKITSIIATAASILALTACSEDKMDEINANKNNPTDMASKFIITEAMTATAFSNIGTDPTFYASCYIEYFVGIFNQFYIAEIRGAQADQSTTYNNAWSSIYSTLKDLKICINKCSEGGSEAGNYHCLGMAQTLTAYNLALLTDLFGDVPWTEALRPGEIYTPKLDSQESIYQAVFALLDDAIANFGKECTFTVGSQDLYYGNNIDLWTKFAYGLKARYTMRLLLRSSDKNADLQNVIEYANKSFQSPDEEAKFAIYDGKSAVSPFYRFYQDRNYLGASKSFDDLLVELEDPREPIYYKEVEGKDFLLAPNGKPKQQQGLYAISGITNATAPTFLLSYHEVEFLKAEAYARLGNTADAQNACANGIKAACKKTNVNVPDDQIDEYVDKVKSRMNGSAALKEVAVQKYIAFYEEEAAEAYNDIRRWKALGEDHISLAHPQPNKFPLRFAYGSSDVTANTNVYNAFETVKVYEDNVWWAGGSR